MQSRRGEILRRYLRSVPGAEPETRMRIYNLIRDLKADAYGGWQFVVARQAGGGLNARCIMMHRTYPVADAKAKALAAAKG